LRSRWGNAHLAAVAIYTQRVPALQALLEQQGNDLPRVYAAVRELAAIARCGAQRAAGRPVPLL